MLFQSVAITYADSLESLAQVSQGVDTQPTLFAGHGGQPTIYPVKTSPTLETIALESARLSSIAQVTEGIFDWEPEIEGVEHED